MTLASITTNETPAYTIRAVVGTHPGLVRTLNEDSALALVRPDKLGSAAALFVVADGMGGHKAGEIASQLAVDTVRQYLTWLVDVPSTQDQESGVSPLPPLIPVAELLNDDIYPPLSFLEAHLYAAVSAANRAIYAHAQNNPSEAGNLGTTLTCVMIVGKEAYVANVGDSRTYHIRQGKMELATQDHSYVGHLVRLGQISADAVFDHPQRHLITRSLGHEYSVKIDVQTLSLEPGDRFLLCSDGLWEMMRDSAEFTQLANTPSLDESVNQLIATANKHGGADNISIVLAELTPTLTQ